MDDRLVFELVWMHAVLPRHARAKRRHADCLHEVVCASGLGAARESSVRGMMECLQVLSEAILARRGFAPTPRAREHRADVYYPLRIRALDLAPRRA